MKTQMKRVSKKMIAVVLALALVVSCVTVSFSVFAADAYAVKSSAPVIPMYVNKAITLSNLSIEVNGVMVNGADLTWEVTYGVSARVQSGKILGAGVGHTRFKTTDKSGNTQNVWVFVNAQGDNDFALLNSDFSNATTYALDDWITGASGNSKASTIYTHGALAMWTGASQPGIVGAGNVLNGSATHVYHYLPNGDYIDQATLKVGTPSAQDGYFATFYKSEELKDFSDYTVDYNVSDVIVSGEAGQTSRVTNYTGLVVRAATTDDVMNLSYNGSNLSGQKALKAGTKSLFLRFRNYGGVMLNAFDVNGGKNDAETTNYLYGDPANMYYTGDINPDDLWIGGNKDLVMWPTPQSGSACETIRNIKVELKGKGIKYSLDGNVIFDTIANNDVKGMFTSVNTEGVATAAISEANDKLSSLNVGEYEGQYTTVDTLTHSQYEDLYEQNLQAEKGTFGFVNAYGTITHIYDVRVDVAGIDLDNMPTMTDTVVAQVFEVPTTSPAIPLYVGKGIDLSMLNIGIGTGKTTGENLTWNRVSGSSAKVNKDGKLVGLAEGNSCFEVSNGTDTQRVWVIVNAVGDDDFAIINLDFTKEGTFNKDDWVTGYNTIEGDVKVYSGQNNKTYNIMSNGDYRVADYVLDPSQPIIELATPTVKTTSGNVAQSALYLRSFVGADEEKPYLGNTVAIYKDEMMNDFHDYSVNADISVHMESDEEEHQMAAPGIFLRATLNDGAGAGDLILDGDTKCYLFRFRNYAGPEILAPNSELKGIGTSQWETPFLSAGAGTCYFTKSATITNKELLLKGAGTNKALILYPDARSETNLTKRNLKIDVADIDLRYTLDGNVIVDTFEKKALSRVAMSYKVPDGVNTDIVPFKIEADISGDVSYPTYKGTIWAQNMFCEKGTVGLANNYGEGLYVYSFQVIAKNIADAKAMPAFEDDVDLSTSYFVPVNTRIDLSQVAEGVEWKDVQAKEYEVKNGQFIAYALPRNATITVNGTKNGAPVSGQVTIAKAGTATDFNTVTVAPAAITLSVANGVYTAKIGRTADFSIGSLKVINANGDGEDLVLLDVKSDGLSYDFTADMSVAVVEANIVTEQEAVQELAVIGADLRTTQGNEAVRFKTRIPAIRKDNKNNINLYANGVDVDGKTVTFENVGVLIIPTALLDGNALTIDLADESFDPTSADAIAYVNGNKAKNIPIQKLSLATSKLADAYATINFNNADGYADKLDVEFTVAPYIQYKDAQGTVGYIFADQISKSYNDILPN